MVHTEEEIKAHLLSDAYFGELVAAYGEEEATKHIARLQRNQHLLTKEAREMIAWQVERAAVAKYRNGDPWYWLKDVERTDQEGRKYTQQEGVTPPPYGSKYFYFFIDKIINSTPSNIYSYLDNEFSGDQCDRMYLEGLLDDMEVEGYFDETKLINWLSGDGAKAIHDIEPRQVISASEVLEWKLWRYFRGRPENRKRVDIVRRWIADKSKGESVKKADSKQSEGRAKSALLIKITLDQVRSIFTQARLGGTSGAGEWATALIALSIAGVLVGTPSQIMRWFEINVPEGITSRETIQRLKGWTESDQFSKDQGEIFKKVLREAKRLLSKEKT